MSSSSGDVNEVFPHKACINPIGTSISGEAIAGRFDSA